MIEEVLDGLVKIFGPIATLAKTKRELQDSALSAISTALDETYLYYRDLEKGSERNMERETLLVKYWSAAAIPVRHFDGQLANICDLKSEYWLNPEIYSEQQLDELNIRLSDIRVAYRNMLRTHSFFQKTISNNSKR